MQVLVIKGILKALLKTMSIEEDTRAIMVSLQGVENVLDRGMTSFTDEKEENPFATELEIVKGIDVLEKL
jgi:hypothetical protein